MKRYFITSAVLLLIVSAFSTWQLNCGDGCVFEQVAFGLPVFLTSPYLPNSGYTPAFNLTALIGNAIWLAFVSTSYWAVTRTLRRWRSRRPPAAMPFGR